MTNIELSVQVLRDEISYQRRRIEMCKRQRPAHRLPGRADRWL